MAFENGINKYIEAEYTVKVYFPVDDKGREYVACRYCPYLSSNERMCQLNKGVVHFPHETIGFECPLTIAEKEKDNGEDN